MARPAQNRPRGSQRQSPEDEKAKRLAQEIRDRNLAETMGTPAGRGFVWELLDKAKVWNSTFDSTAMVFAHNEGQRNLGNWVLDRIKAACPTAFMTMLNEHWTDDNGDGSRKSH